MLRSKVVMSEGSRFGRTSHVDCVLYGCGSSAILASTYKHPCSDPRIPTSASRSNSLHLSILHNISSSPTMPARTRYVQPLGSPSGAFTYSAGSSNGASSYYPSPTYTMSSLSASPGPMTPPQIPPPFLHSRSLYACAPLPALSGMPGHIHPALSGAHGRHTIVFDVASDPADLGLSPRVLAEPATSPPLPCLFILLPGTPWHISIHPSSSKGAYVTVADVLTGIYRGLRRQVQKEEVETLPVSQPFMASVRQAFYSRCSRLTRVVDAAAVDSEARKGIRRIDFLLGNHMFRGLLATPDSPDMWKLSVSSES
jgi:hypothetical protein